MLLYGVYIVSTLFCIVSTLFLYCFHLVAILCLYVSTNYGRRIHSILFLYCSLAAALLLYSSRSFSIFEVLLERPRPKRWKKSPQGTLHSSPRAASGSPLGLLWGLPKAASTRIGKFDFIEALPKAAFGLLRGAPGSDFESIFGICLMDDGDQ